MSASKYAVVCLTMEWQSVSSPEPYRHWAVSDRSVSFRQANNIGFLPSIGIGPGAAHSGTNSGSIGEPQGVMPSGLPDSLLSDDPTSAAMRQRVPNGNVRRDGVIRGQRGRGGLQPQGVPHRGRGVPRGAVRCAKQALKLNLLFDQMPVVCPSAPELPSLQFVCNPAQCWSVLQVSCRLTLC